jgi:4-hydroxy-tetrahydrodipicolinate synthase
MSAEFGRVITAMITPMTSSGEVDLAQTGELAKALVASGTETIVSTGTTGEAPTLSDDEQFAVWRATKDAVGADLTVIAGATDNDTAASIARARVATEMGLDGVLLTVPAYNKPTQAGLIAHFTAIAAATSLPCMLYNVPSRTALNMTAATTIELSAVPNMVGIKEASGDLEQIAQIIEHSPDDFGVWSGNDGDTLPILAIGGFGVVSVASHLVGRQISAMIAASLAGEHEAAAVMHRKMLPLVDAIFFESSPSPLKFALREIGFDAGPPRLPLLEASEAAQAQMRAELSKQTIDLPVPTPLRGA